jgi:hypothetical protein
MTTPSDIQTALANEARRTALKTREANLQGMISATASLQARLATVNSDAGISLAAVQAELASLEAGAGPGVTADFGPKSSVTQMLETERVAAKAAVVDYVKANPTCSETDAKTAWDGAAIASHPQFPSVLQDALAMSALYRTNLVAAGVIHENTWEAQRDWMAVTDKSVILGM